MSGISLLLTLTTAVYGVLSPQKINNAIALSSFIPLEKNIYHQLGDKKITIKVFHYGEFNKNLCINLHDDEITAVSAAHTVLEQIGGVLIKIENNKKRIISFPFKGVVYSFDPNRIFSKPGIKLTLKTKGKINPLAVIEVEKFASRLLQLIPDNTTCIIALHNNTDGNYSVKSYQQGGKRQHDASQVYADNWQDADDITFTTNEKLFNQMSKMGYNSILQDNEKVNKDGSLSVYFGEQKKRYINIETQHGKTVLYKEMLVKLLYFLEGEKKIENSQAVIEVD